MTNAALPTLRHIILAVFALAVVVPHAAAAKPMRDAPAVVDIDLKKVTGIFDLTNQAGARVTQKDFPGKYRLVYFGYTSCPDMCPTGLQAMSLAMDMLGARAIRVQPIFITVDPVRDTPERLRDYLTAFDPAITALRGDEAQTEAAAEAFQVDYERVEDEEGTDADYVVEHNSPIFLFTPEGKLLKAFPENIAPAKIVKTLRTALNIRD